MAGPDVAESFGVGGWRFTDEVVYVFPEHVRASVPFYDAMQDMIAETTDWLVPGGGLVADLGALTGTTALRILERQPGREIRFALYDEQAAMLDRARAAVEAVAPGRVACHVARIQDGPYAHENADLTVSVFTLQFLSYADRLAALKLARKGAARTGALIVGEKIRPADTRWAEIAGDVSHDYKAAQGISDAAIRAKARALRGVLRPLDQDSTLGLISDAGWARPEVLFRWHQWAVIGAFASA